MYEFHSRHKIRIPGVHSPSIPISQTQALDRRHSLDAQQRTYREPAVTGQSRHASDTPTGLKAARRRQTPRPWPDESGRDVDIEARDLSGGELGERDTGHGGVVGAERQRRDENLDPELGGHLDEPLPQAGNSPPRRRRRPAVSSSTVSVPGGSWPRSRQPPLPGSSRPRR